VAPVTATAATGAPAAARSDTPVAGLSAPRGAADVPEPAAQVAQTVIHLIDTASGGRVIIQLSPEHLGRVEVQIDRTAAGITHISLTAERPGTLSLLQDNQHQLSAALDRGGAADAGRILSFHAEPGAPLDPPSPKQGVDPQIPLSSITAPEAAAANPSAPSTAAGGHPPNALAGGEAGTGTSASDRQPQRQQPGVPVRFEPAGALVDGGSDEPSSPLAAKASFTWNSRLNITA